MPVLDPDLARAFAEDMRRQGRRIVFTDGLYDLLHPGHVRYLVAAREQGDALIVGVNSDRSVRADRGPSRPITPARERAEIVAALGSVDAVVIFDQLTLDGVIRLIQPDVLVKGADWPADQIVGRDAVEARGGGVVQIPVEQGWSTTSIIESIQRKTRT
jgi:rfaE bifunctional protein nucleotidyltransferase chain/domain